MRRTVGNPYPPRHRRTAPRNQIDYERNRKRSLRHLSAVTATALKLTRIDWRICIDQRDYLPAGRPTTPAPPP